MHTCTRACPHRRTQMNGRQAGRRARGQRAACCAHRQARLRSVGEHDCSVAHNHSVAHHSGEGHWTHVPPCSILSGGELRGGGATRGMLTFCQLPGGGGVEVAGPAPFCVWVVADESAQHPAVPARPRPPARLNKVRLVRCACRVGAGVVDGGAPRGQQFKLVVRRVHGQRQAGACSRGAGPCSQDQWRREVKAEGRFLRHATAQVWCRVHVQRSGVPVPAPGEVADNERQG